MEIKPLSNEVRSQLRSGTSNINDIPHCVMELVFNSLDANASSIAVRINILTFRLQIVDNGCGVTKSNFEKIAERYMSSKCHSLKDYNKHPKYYGYRGESLASIRQNCGKLTIASRAYKSTYSKSFEGGNCGDVIEISHRPSEGTTVTVEDFLKNLPVRKNRVNSELDLEGVKSVLASLAIIHPSVKFSLRNDITKKTVFQNVSSDTVEEAFLKAHDDIDSAHLSQLKITKGKVSIVGLIYKKILHVNKYQYVYVNKRPVHIMPLGGVIHDVFSNSAVCKDFKNGQHFAYILNIRCPHAYVHYTTSSAKTTAEFSNWDVIAKCVERVIINCLEKSGLVIDNLPMIVENVCKEDKQFNLMDIGGVVMAKATKTQGFENVKDTDKHTEISKCDQIETKVQNKNVMAKATITKRIKGSDKSSADTKGDQMKTKVHNKSVMNKATKTKRCLNGSNKSNQLETKIQNIRVVKKSLNNVCDKGKKMAYKQNKKENNNCNKISNSGSSKISKSDDQILNSENELFVNNKKISPKRKQTLRLYDCSFKKFKKARKINNTTKKQLQRKVPLMYDVMADANSLHTSEDIKIDEYPESNNNDINNQTLGKAIILNKFLTSVELQRDEPDDSLYEEEQLERKSTVSISCRIKSRGKHKRISSERISNVSYTRRIHRKRRRRSELPDDTIEAVEMVSKCMQTTLIMDQILPTDQVHGELEGTDSEHKQLDIINTRISNYKPLKSMNLNNTSEGSDVQFTTNLTIDLDGSAALNQGPNVEVSKDKTNKQSNMKTLDRPLENDVSFSVYFPRPNKQPKGLSKRQSYESSNIEPPKDFNAMERAEETFSEYFPRSHKHTNILSRRQSKIEPPKDLNILDQAKDYFPRPNNISDSQNSFSKPMLPRTLDFQTGLVDEEMQSQYFSRTNEKNEVPFESSNYKIGRSSLYRIISATNVHKEKHEKKTDNKPLRGILKNKIIKGSEKMILGQHVTTPVTGIFFPIKKHALDLSGIFKKPRTEIKDTTNNHFRMNTRIFGNRNHKRKPVHERNLTAPIPEYILKGNILNANDITFSGTVSEQVANNCNDNTFENYSKQVDTNEVQKSKSFGEKVPYSCNDNIFGTYTKQVDSNYVKKSANVPNTYNDNIFETYSKQVESNDVLHSKTVSDKKPRTCNANIFEKYSKQVDSYGVQKRQTVSEKVPFTYNDNIFGTYSKQVDLIDVEQTKTVSDKKPNSCNANILGIYSTQVDSNDLQKRQTISEKVPITYNENIFGTYTKHIESTDFQSEITKHVDEIISNIYKNLPLGNYRKEYWETREERKREQIGDGNHVFDLNPSATIRKPSILYDPAYDENNIIFDEDYRLSTLHHKSLFDNNNHNEFISANNSIIRDERKLHYKPQQQNLVLQKKDFKRKEKLDSERKLYPNQLSAREFDNKNASDLISFPNNVNDLDALNFIITPDMNSCLERNNISDNNHEYNNNRQLFKPLKQTHGQNFTPNALNLSISPNISNSCLGGNASNFPNNLNDLDALNFTIEPNMNSCLESNNIWGNNTRPLFNRSNKTNGQYFTRNALRNTTDNLMYTNYHYHKCSDTENFNKQQRYYGNVNRMHSVGKVKRLCSNDHNSDLACNNVKPMRFGTTKIDQDYNTDTLDKKTYDIDNINTTKLHASRKSHDNVLENRGFQEMFLENSESYKSYNTNDLKGRYDVAGAMNENYKNEDFVNTNKSQHVSNRRAQEYDDAALEYINNKPMHFLRTETYAGHKHMDSRSNEKINFQYKVNKSKHTYLKPLRTETHKIRKGKQLDNINLEKMHVDSLNYHGEILKNTTNKSSRFFRGKTCEDNDYENLAKINRTTLDFPNKKAHNEGVMENTDHQEEPIQRLNRYKEDVYQESNPKKIEFTKRTKCDYNDVGDYNQNQMRFLNKRIFEGEISANTIIANNNYKLLDGTNLEDKSAKCDRDYNDEVLMETMACGDGNFINCNRENNKQHDIIDVPIKYKVPTKKRDREYNDEVLTYINCEPSRRTAKDYSGVVYCTNYKEMYPCKNTNNDINDHIEEQQNYKEMRLLNTKPNEDINYHIDERKNYMDMRFPNRKRNEDINDYIKEHQDYKERRVPNRKSNEDINLIDDSQNYQDMPFANRKTCEDINDYIGGHQNYKETRIPNRNINADINDHIDEHQNCKAMCYSNRKTNKDLNDHIDEHQNYKDMLFPNRKTNEDINDYIDEHKNYKEMRFPSKTTNEDIYDDIEVHQNNKQMRFPNRKTMYNINDHIDEHQNSKAMRFSNRRTNKDLNDDIDEHQNYKEIRFPNTKINEDINDHIDEHKYYKEMRFSSKTTNENFNDDIEDHQNYKDMRFPNRKTIDHINNHIDEHQNCKEMRFSNSKSNKDLNDHIDEHHNYKDMCFTKRKTNGNINDHVHEHQQYKAQSLLNRKTKDDINDHYIDEHTNYKQMRFPIRKTTDNFNNHIAEQQNDIEMRFPNRRTNEDINDRIEEHQNCKEMCFGNRKTDEDVNNHIEQYQNYKEMRFPNRKTSEDVNDHIEEHPTYKEIRIPNSVVVQPQQKQIQYPNEKICHENSLHAPSKTYTNYHDGQNEINQKLFSRINTHQVLNSNNNKKLHLACGKTLDDNIDGIFVNRNQDFRMRRKYEGYNVLDDSNYNEMRCLNRKMIEGGILKDTIENKIQFPSAKYDQDYNDEVLMETNQEPMYSLGSKFDEDGDDEIFDKINMKEDNMNFPSIKTCENKSNCEIQNRNSKAMRFKNYNAGVLKRTNHMNLIQRTIPSTHINEDCTGDISEATNQETMSCLPRKTCKAFDGEIFVKQDSVQFPYGKCYEANSDRVLENEYQTEVHLPSLKAYDCNLQEKQQEQMHFPNEKAYEEIFSNKIIHVPIKTGYRENCEVTKCNTKSFLPESSNEVYTNMQFPNEIVLEEHNAANNYQEVEFPCKYMYENGNYQKASKPHTIICGENTEEMLNNTNHKPKSTFGMKTHEDVNKNMQNSSIKPGSGYKHEVLENFGYKPNHYGHKGANVANEVHTIKYCDTFNKPVIDDDAESFRAEHSNNEVKNINSKDDRVHNHKERNVNKNSDIHRNCSKHIQDGYNNVTTNKPIFGSRNIETINFDASNGEEQLPDISFLSNKSMENCFSSKLTSTDNQTNCDLHIGSELNSSIIRGTEPNYGLKSIVNTEAINLDASNGKELSPDISFEINKSMENCFSSKLTCNQNKSDHKSKIGSEINTSTVRPAQPNYALKSIFGSQFDDSNKKEQLLDISSKKSIENCFSSKIISKQRKCNLPSKTKTELINPSIVKDIQPKSDLMTSFGNINTEQNYFNASNEQKQSSENVFDSTKSRNCISSKITNCGNENPKIKNIGNDKCSFNAKNRYEMSPEISFDEQMLQTTENMGACSSLQDLNTDYQTDIDMTLYSDNNDFIGADLNTQAKLDSRLNCSDDEQDEANNRRGVNLKTKWNRCDSKQDKPNNCQNINFKTKLNHKDSRHDSANISEGVSSNRSDLKPNEVNDHQSIHLKAKLNFNHSKQDETNYREGINVKTKLISNGSKQDEVNNRQGTNVKTKLISNDPKQDEVNNRQGTNVETNLMSNDSKQDEADNRQGINVKTKLIPNDSKQGEANNRQGIQVKTKLNSNDSKQDAANSSMNVFWQDDFLDSKLSTKFGKAKTNEFSFYTKPFSNKSNNNKMFHTFGNDSKVNKNEELDCKNVEGPDSHFSFDTDEFMKKSFDPDFCSLGKNSGKFNLDYDIASQNLFHDEKSGSYINKLKLENTAKENSHKRIKNNTSSNNNPNTSGKNTVIGLATNTTINNQIAKQDNAIHILSNIIVHRPLESTEATFLNFTKSGNCIISDNIKKDVKRKSLLKLVTSPIRITDKPSNIKSKYVSTNTDGGTVVDYNLPKNSQYIASNQRQQDVIFVRSKKSQDQTVIRTDKCEKHDLRQVCSKKSLGQAVSGSDKCEKQDLMLDMCEQPDLKLVTSRSDKCQKQDFMVDVSKKSQDQSITRKDMYEKQDLKLVSSSDTCKKQRFISDLQSQNQFNQNQGVRNKPKLKLPISPTQASNVSKTKLVFNTSANFNPFDSGTLANIDYDLPKKAPSQNFEGPNDEISFNLEEGDYAARLNSQIEKFESASNDLSFNLTNENDDKQDAYLSDSYAIDMLQSCHRSPDWIANLDAKGKMFYVHKRTGTTTSKRPNDGETFNMKKRINAVPKGCSPMLSGKEIIETSMSQSGKKTLYHAIMQQYEEELGTIKWMNIHKTGVDPRRFFDPIYDNYKTKIAADIPDISKKGLSKFGKAERRLNEMTFTKDIFNGLFVIGQLDKKFIVALAADKSLLLLFDQHAVHERIRVEKLQNDYKMDRGRDEVIEFKTTQLNKYCTINATEEEINMMSMYRPVFETIGLKYTIVDGAILQILEAPTCIYNKYSKNKDDENLVQLLKCLIEELVETLQITRGALSTTPKVIQNIINMEACRGAVMFGDVLTINECRNHLKALSMCKLPFQCAHGRPTMTPLIELKQLEIN